MEFDHFTVALLVLRDDAPDLTPQQAAALQDGHLAHLLAPARCATPIPAGAMSFAPARFPRSVAEATGAQPPGPGDKPGG
ncbi:MAG TPA: hypothetical protein VIJ82_13105 [Streptosporangiaceae bacterium]|jgi:hypothetical protein